LAGEGSIVESERARDGHAFRPLERNRWRRDRRPRGKWRIGMAGLPGLHDTCAQLIHCTEQAVLRVAR